MGPKIAPTADWMSLWPSNVARAIVWTPVGIVAASRVGFLPPPTPPIPPTPSVSCPDSRKEWQEYHEH